MEQVGEVEQADEVEQAADKLAWKAADQDDKALAQQAADKAADDSLEAAEEGAQSVPPRTHCECPAAAVLPVHAPPA